MSVALAFGFHAGNGGVIEDLDDATLEAAVKVVGAKGFALLAKVADVELEIDAELVTDFFLIETIGRTLLSEECADFVDFVGREFGSSHS